MINIEIKARCKEPEKIRKILNDKQAEFKGRDHQIDTYFKVNKGRLKLREGSIENGLIYYERENSFKPKKSNYLLHKINPDTALKEILMKMFKVLIIVDKKREIYYLGNVKFHIDEVKMLGTYLEIEATDAGGKIEVPVLKEQCSHFMEIFKIEETDLISRSYSDMLLELSAG